MITIKDVQYQALKMPPRQQFHVLRRLAPLLGAAGPALMGLLDESKNKDEAMQEIAQALGPVATILATLPDEQLDYVLDACMLVTQRLDVDQRWHPVAIATNQGLRRMYADIDSGMELRLAAEALKVNASGFFEQLSGESASPLSSQPAAPSP